MAGKPVIPPVGMCLQNLIGIEVVYVILPFWRV
jgi:hypothetical protein